MKRFDRIRFVAWGLLPSFNAVGLLIYGLHLATSGTGGAGRSLPALIFIALVCMVISSAAAIKRGRDLNWPALVTTLAFWFSLTLGLTFLALIAYFSFARSKPSADRFGPAPEPMGVIGWGWAVMNLIWPWVILAILAKVL
jgi:hypothetical protein